MSIVQITRIAEEFTSFLSLSIESPPVADADF